MDAQTGENKAQPVDQHETPIEKNVVVSMVNSAGVEVDQQRIISKKCEKMNFSSKETIIQQFYSFSKQQQKWKSAFKNPYGKLALNVGANFPESKHKFVQTFKGHADGVWHVCTAQVGTLTQIVASASAGDHLL